MDTNEKSSEDNWRSTCRRILKEVNESDYIRAFYETALIWSISSLVPIATLWFVGALTKQPDYSSFVGLTHAIDTFFVPTEVFLYVTAIMAPSVAYMFFYWKARRHIGLYNFFLTLFCLVLGSTAVVYAIAKAGVDLDRNVVFNFAIASYILAICSWYAIQVHQKKFARLLSSARPPSGSGIKLDA